MAEKWFKLRDSNFIVKSTKGDNGTVQRIIWRSLTHEQFISLYFFTFGSTAIISIFGVFSNMTNVYVFLRARVKEGVDVSLLGLSMSDFLFTLVKSVSSLTNLFLTTEMLNGPQFHTDPALLWYFISGIVIILYTLSTFITMFIAIVRCACVIMPLQFKHVFTARRCVVIMVLCGLLASALNIPSLASVDIVPEFVEHLNRTRLVRYNLPLKDMFRGLVQLSTHLTVPLVSQGILLLCVLVMTYAMKKSARFREKAMATSMNPPPSEDMEESKTGLRGGKLSQKELQVVRQVLLVSIVFILCNMPDLVYGVLSYCYPEIQKSAKKNGNIRLYKMLKQIRHFFMSLNGAVNMFIYFRYNRKYREFCEANFKLCKKTAST